MLAWASIFRPFTDTNVYRTGGYTDNFYSVELSVVQTEFTLQYNNSTSRPTVHVVPTHARTFCFSSIFMAWKLLAVLCCDNMTRPNEPVPSVLTRSNSSRPAVFYTHTHTPVGVHSSRVVTSSTCHSTVIPATPCYRAATLGKLFTPTRLAGRCGLVVAVAGCGVRNHRQYTYCDSHSLVTNL